jgi:hypothetical protein
MQYQEVLDKIEEIKLFLKSIGFKQKNEFPDDWNLDSTIDFVVDDPFYYSTTFKNESRVVLKIEVGIVGGILVLLSGKYGSSVFQSIKTDYNFKAKYEEGQFFVEELRNWNINNVLD